MSSPGILITGTGFLSGYLRKKLEKNNCRIHFLSRTPVDSSSYRWDMKTRWIDPAAFENVHTIIHLAGASLADGRWTAERKKEIIDSRVNSAKLIYEKLKLSGHSIQTFISASAVGIYGDAGDEWISEDHSISPDFLGETCRLWESAARRFADLGIRVVILRIGVVLSGDGGALPVMARPVKLFAGAPLGSGNQFMSWIHIDDLCSIFLKAVEDGSMNGIYNAVAPNPVTNKEFMTKLASALHRPLWPFNVPAWLLKILLGEKSKIVLDGQRVSAQKLRDSGFTFNFSNLEQAIHDITD